MSSVVRSALLLSGIAAFSTRGAAQVPDHLASQAARVDAAHRVVDAAIARKRADSAHRAILPVARTYAGLAVRMDTTQINPAFRAALDRAFVLSHVRARALFGASADTLLHGFTVSITADVPGTDSTARGRFVAMRTDTRPVSTGPGEVAPLGGYATEDAHDIDVDRLSARIDDWYAYRAGLELPASIRLWGGAFVAFHANARAENHAAYRRLKFAGSRIAESCLAGVTRACREALGIVPGSDTLTTWYEALIQDGPAARWHRGLHRDAQGRFYYERNSCASNADACARNWDNQGHYIAESLRLTDRAARQQLLRRALEIGGPAAYDRLIAARSADIATALDVASGGKLDSIVAAWGVGVRDAPAPSPRPNAMELGLCVLFGVAAIGLAAGRHP